MKLFDFLFRAKDETNYLVFDLEAQKYLEGNNEQNSKGNR
jgi:hypothetical protein